MKKKLIIRISNEIGNQMFMYASAYSIAKKMNRELFIDNETAFLLKKNISKYALNNFKITSKVAGDNLKFKKISGYLTRKFLQNIDLVKSNKSFYIEPKNYNKIANHNENFLNKNFSDNLFLEGHFESEKYFLDFKKDIIKEFIYFDHDKFVKNPYYKNILNNNSVGICLRQNRFSEGIGQNNVTNNLKSNNFTIEQINYINKSVSIIKSKLENPTFYIWSNELRNMDFQKFNFKFTTINLSNHDENIDNRALAMFLLSQCKHFITIPSAFTWWGAWLSKYNNKIIIRPSSDCFSDFFTNNLDYWPADWIAVNEKS